MSRANPDANYELCLILMCQCRLIQNNNCNIVVGDSGSLVIYAYVGEGRYMEEKSPFVLFNSCKTKIALK